MKKITANEWLREGKRLFGDDMKQWKFKCPSCGHIQTLQDFLDLGFSQDEAEGVFFYSCIGRWMESEGILFNKKSPCNYTLGGLFTLAETIVIDEDNEIPVFEFAVRKE